MCINKLMTSTRIDKLKQDILELDAKSFFLLLRFKEMLNLHKDPPAEGRPDALETWEEQSLDKVSHRIEQVILDCDALTNDVERDERKRLILKLQTMQSQMDDLRLHYSHFISAKHWINHILHSSIKQ